MVLSHNSLMTFIGSTELMLDRRSSDYDQCVIFKVCAVKGIQNITMLKSYALSV